MANARASSRPARFFQGLALAVRSGAEALDGLELRWFTVNFFSHAALAAYERANTGFVFGAMLPDFASMIGARPPGVLHGEIEAGVAFHHRTDHVFHESATFRRLCQTALEALKALGVRHGSARAVAHVGTEILLDGVLAQDARARLAYTQAIEQAVEAELGQYVSWRKTEERARFAELQAALQQRGIAPEYAAPEVVVRSLSRTLASRPRLALEPGADALVLLWVRSAQSEVTESAGALLTEVSHGLWSA
jgi:hypothetical protein